MAKKDLALAMAVKDKHKKAKNKPKEDFGKVIKKDGPLTDSQSMYQKGTEFQEANSKRRRGEQEPEEFAKGGTIARKIRAKQKGR